MKGQSDITLAIESAIGGGSLSLIRDGGEIANWTGTSNVARAEDLLANIDAMLTSNGVSRFEIGQVAVSAGPGSFTGIRIGIATALGLKMGLGIEMSSESALKAMAFSQADAENLVAALPVGRDAVCLQSFSKTANEITPLNDPHTLSEQEFLSSVSGAPMSVFVLHSSLFEKMGSTRAIDFGKNLALWVGLICRENHGRIVEPLFVSKSF